MICLSSGNEDTIALKAGQKVMLIQTPKGVYLRMGEKIIKIPIVVNTNIACLSHIYVIFSYEQSDQNIFNRLAFSKHSHESGNQAVW